MDDTKLNSADLNSTRRELFVRSLEVITHSPCGSLENECFVHVLLGFSSTWDVPDLELVMGDPNTLLRRLSIRVLNGSIVAFG